MYQTFLPVILSNGKLFSASLGAQVEGDVAPRAQWLRPGRIIEWAVKWAQVEATRGVYAWPGNYEDSFAALEGYETIIGIKCVPAWARLWPEAGSPPKPACYLDLKRFIQAVQERYHPQAVELFNEPDTKRTPGLPYGEFFGAWVQDNESWYQGGQRYGACVEAVYPNLGSKLLAGALAMHDDSLEFLRGALDAGMRSKCDAISFHSYVSNPEQFNRPVEHARAISQLAAYDIPLVMTETSVTGAADNDELRQWQVDYLSNLRGWGDVLAKLWYSLANNNWACSDLVVNDQAKPVYAVWSGGA